MSAVPMAVGPDETEPTKVLPLDEAPARARKPPRYTPSSRPDNASRRPRVAGASEVWALMRPKIEHAPVEEFWVLALDVRHRVLSMEMRARGSMTGVEVHPRDVFRPLIVEGAAAVVFVHNHPSGDSSPSRADVELTDRFRKTGELVGIPVLDHVVIGDGGYTSLAERNWR